jgi:hydrogenase maturation protease
MKGILVIGYGNTLRGDDGAGVQAAELIGMFYPNVHCLTVHQLTIDLAETLSQHGTVVFLDASVAVNKLTVTSLQIESQDANHDSHVLTPLTLLNVTHQLYGRSPKRALQVEIPAADFAFGESPSRLTKESVDELVREFPTVADSPLSRWASSLR